MDLTDREMFRARSVKVIDMSEREPDTSASTAEFRAFAQSGSESAPPWAMRASGRRVAILTVSVIAVAVVLGLVAVLVINM
ncbi:MAG: hypothetical protein ABJB47_12960 [Actinomycetota bacterium]